MASVWWDEPDWFAQRGVVEGGRVLPNPVEGETVLEEQHGVKVIMGDDVLLIPWGRVIAVREERAQEPRFIPG